MSEYKRKMVLCGVLAIMLVTSLSIASNFLHSELSQPSLKEGKTQPSPPQKDIMEEGEIQPSPPQEDVIVYFLPQGAVMTYLNVRQLTQRAETIIIGNVTEIMPSQSDPETGIIYTDAMVDIQTFMKISLNQSTILVRTLGGTVGNLAMWAEDEIGLTKGDRILLFLGRTEFSVLYGSALHVIGGHQGKYILQNGMAINEDPSRNTTLEELLEEIEKAI